MPRYYYYGARDTADGARKLDLFWLRKNMYLTGLFSGTITWSRNGDVTGKIGVTVDTREYPHIEFDYRIKLEGEARWSNMSYRFPMVKIPCRYGGNKWFFICGLNNEGKYCGKRVRILYPVGKFFGCRTCANLSYESCNENKKFRGGAFGLVSRSFKADDCYEKIRNHFYKGKPTRRYKKYLELSNFTESEEIVIKNFTKLLNKKN